MLNLSTNSLSPKTCHVLGKVITTDRTFVEIKFADCMLSEDGRLLKFAFIIDNHSFTGISILWLFMTGFNLGLFFIYYQINIWKINSGINSLTLSFAAVKGLCHGLATNSYCKFLDLKVSNYFLECYFSFIEYNIIKAKLRIFFIWIINNNYIRKGLFFFSC